MQCVRLFFIGLIFTTIQLSSTFAADKEFDSEQILSDLEKQLELSSEQLSSLKPAIDAKGVELKKSIHESVDKGFIQLDKLSQKLENISRDVEKKAGEILNSEEMNKLKNYLSKIDKKAVSEMKDKAVADLSDVLELTEEQLVKLKPVIEDGFTQMEKMFDDLAKEGNKSWEGFKEQYEELREELQGKMQDTLDDEQMKRLEKYNEEKKVKLQKAFYSV
jgi:hypothetical protein